MTLRRWPRLAALLLASCTAPEGQSPASDPCQELVHAPPEQWPERLRAAHALGGPAAMRLVQL
ncbi:MAG: hypothetical protein WBO45_26550, partial [Planctomycetota bacterium]